MGGWVEWKGGRVGGYGRVGRGGVIFEPLRVEGSVGGPGCVEGGYR